MSDLSVAGLAAIGLLSAAVLAYEIALMRLLALAGWAPHNALVISTALLGFGASGSLLAVWAPRLRAAPAGALTVLALGTGISLVPATAVSQWIPFSELELLAEPAQWGWLLVKQLALFVPFLLAGGAIGWALSAWGPRASAIYGANMIGSGLGAAAAVLAMYRLTPVGLIRACGMAAMLAGLIACASAASPGARTRRVAIGVLVVGLAVWLTWVAVPLEPRISPHKGLSSALRQGAEVIVRRPTPLGQVDVAAGETLRQVPDMSLTHSEPVAPQRLLFVDADGGAPIPRIDSPSDWAAFDAAAPAVVHRVGPHPNVLVMGLDNLWQAGLARLHGASSITICEPNPAVTDAVRSLGPGWCDWLFDDPRVLVRPTDGRGLLGTTGRRFDLIVFPFVPATVVGGLDSDYLLTVESVRTAVGRLSDDGVVAITAATRSPPRAEIRLFATAVSALRAAGYPRPGEQLVWVRYMATATLLIKPRAWYRTELAAVRAFCDEKCFDLAWTPDMTAEEANRWFELDQPYYHNAAAALLSDDADEFLDLYVFAVAARTDDKPFFHDFFKLSSVRYLRDRTQGRWLAFVDPVYLLAVVAVAQGALLAAVFILLPLRWVRRGGPGGGRASTLLYFGLLGLGYMTVEMCMIARLEWFLADRVLATSVVLGGFLAISGIGSLVSMRLGPRAASTAAACVAALTLAAAFGLVPFLSLTRGWPLPARLAIAVLTMAPAAFVMGMPFPLGLTRIAAGNVGLRAWAWGINGSLSVTAASLVQVVAAHAGYRAPLIAAAATYAVAAVIATRHDGRRDG